MNEQQKFFKLLKYSNTLKKKEKSLRKEDSEAFNVLLNFPATIENNLHYSEKEEYIELAKNFLADQITPDDFSYSFMAIYEGISRKLGQMERNESLELANFLKPSRPELGRLLAHIYGSCDNFNPDDEIDIAISNEKELKDYAKSLLLKLEEK